MEMRKIVEDMQILFEEMFYEFDCSDATPFLSEQVSKTELELCSEKKCIQVYEYEHHACCEGFNPYK